MLFTTLLALFFSAILFSIYWFITPYIKSLSRPHPLSLDLSYIDLQAPKGPQNRTPRYTFDPIQTDPVLHLSVVIPVKNDEKSLPAMLTNTIAFLQEMYKKSAQFTSEIVIVDDCSSDLTAPLVLSWAQKYTSEFIRLMKLPVEMGKGGAAQIGMLHARGRFILYSDLGATDAITSYPILETALTNMATKDATTGNLLGAVVGSSPLPNPAFSAPILAKLLPTVGLPQFHDTTVGFKLFTRETVKYLSLNQKLQLAHFDIELLYIAKLFKIPTAEVAIQGYQRFVPKSILCNLYGALNAVRNVSLIHALYFLNIWKLTFPQQHAGYGVSYESRIGATQ